MSVSFLACGVGIEPEQRVRKQVDLAKEEQLNRHGFPADDKVEGFPSPAPKTKATSGRFRFFNRRK